MPARIANRHPRLGLKLPVAVRGRDVQGAPFAEEAHTHNVSSGGLCFESQHSLSVGADLEIKIALPPRLRPRFGGRDVYSVRALVCRVERYPGQSTFRVGVRFLGEIDPRS